MSLQGNGSWDPLNDSGRGAPTIQYEGRVKKKKKKNKNTPPKKKTNKPKTTPKTPHPKHKKQQPNPNPTTKNQQTKPTPHPPTTPQEQTKTTPTKKPKKKSWEKDRGGGGTHRISWIHDGRKFHCTDVSKLPTHLIRQGGESLQWSSRKE